MGTATITNLSNCANIKTTMNLVLAHSTPTSKVERALSLLAEIYRGHPMTKEVWISFNRFAGRHINIMIVHWWKGTDYQKYLAGIQEMNLAVKARFDTEGISFAYAGAQHGSSPAAHSSASRSLSSCFPFRGDDLSWAALWIG